MATLRLMAIDAICQRGSVKEADVAILRSAFRNEPTILPSDVDGLLRAHSLARVQAPSWWAFFIDTLTEYVVFELEPEGYVTAGQAGWLVSRISDAGRVRTKTEHDLLVNVIDKARWVPESLMAFALIQIRDAVASGEGPLRVGGTHVPGVLTQPEIEQLRALLYAYGADGPRAITQVEADILLDIDAAIKARQALDDSRDEEWDDLIEKAIANAILSASGHVGPTREEALSPTAPLTDRQATGQRLLRPMGWSGRAILDHYHPLTAELKSLLRLELQRIEIITSEPVTAADPERLAARVIDHDGIYLAARPGVISSLNAAGISLHRAFCRDQPKATSAA